MKNQKEETMKQNLNLYGRLIVEMTVILTVTFIVLSPLFAEEGNVRGRLGLSPSGYLEATQSDLSERAIWESFNATNQYTIPRKPGATQKSLSQLPDDVARLATGWTVVPQEMVEVTRQEGPLAGISLGLIKGSTRLLDNTTSLMDQGRVSSGSGKLFSYTF